MELTKEQIDAYQENGYLIIESLFSKSEIEDLTKASQDFKKLKSLPNVILEENGEIRSVFAPESHHELFEKLYKEKRLVTAVSQLLGDSFYLYQYKLNNKKALKGQSWEWHQDFPYWHIDDGVEKPNMVSVMILFQDTMSLQGPLLLLPGSHKSGVVDFQPKEHLKNKEENILNSLNADLKYTIQEDLLKDYFINDNIVEGKGPIGTCVFFHPNLFHASSSNISPFDRNTAIITYNDINNLPQKEDNRRPEYVCSRKYDRIPC